jgi:hypothetical protein
MGHYGLRAGIRWHGQQGHKDRQQKNAEICHDFILKVRVVLEVSPYKAGSPDSVQPASPPKAITADP